MHHLEDVLEHGHTSLLLLLFLGLWRLMNYCFSLFQGSVHHR